jgi:hypothetical protein
MGVNDHVNGAPQGAAEPQGIDPVAGIRAIADIQAEGLRAASDLLDRVLGRDAPAVPPPNGGSGERSYVPVLDAWASMLEGFAAALSTQGGATVLSIDSEQPGPAVRIRWADGVSTSVELQITNPRSEAAAPIRLDAGALLAPDGSVLDGAAVGVAPAEIPELPARTSVPVTVSLRVARQPRPGTYRGTLQAAGAPALWLPVEVTIESC